MTTGACDASYSLYGLTEEHQLLRKAVRELAEDKIAPRAAEIDEAAEYPWDVHEELKRADLLAHPRARGVRRRRRRPDRALDRRRGDRPRLRVELAHRRRQQARHDGADPVGQRGAQAGVPAAGRRAARRRSPTRCPSARPGCDAAAMRTRAVRDGDSYVLNGTKCWITGAGVNTHYTVMASTDPSKGAKGISRVRRRKPTTPASRSAPRSARSGSRAPRPARSTSRTAASRPTGSSARRAPASSPRSRPSTTPAR